MIMSQYDKNVKNTVLGIGFYTVKTDHVYTLIFLQVSCSQAISDPDFFLRFCLVSTVESCHVLDHHLQGELLIK